MTNRQENGLSIFVVLGILAIGILFGRLDIQSTRIDNVVNKNHIQSLQIERLQADVANLKDQLCEVQYGPLQASNTSTGIKPPPPDIEGVMPPEFIGGRSNDPQKEQQSSAPLSPNAKVAPPTTKLRSTSNETFSSLPPAHTVPPTITSTTILRPTVTVPNPRPANCR